MRDEVLYLATVHWYGRSLQRECLTQVVGAFSSRDEAEALVKQQARWWWFADPYFLDSGDLRGWQPCRDSDHFFEVCGYTSRPYTCEAVWTIDEVPLMPCAATRYRSQQNPINADWPPLLVAA